MRVLHVFDHSIPIHSGYSFRSLAILKELNKSGIETILVTGSKHYGSKEAIEVVDGYSFHRTEAGRFSNYPLLNQLDVILTLRNKVKQLIEEYKPDIIHCHSPALNALAVAKLARKNKIPFVYEMRASWEDAAVSHGTCKEGDLRYRVGQYLEKRALHSANHVTTICKGLAEQITEWGIEEKNITVVPNAVDLSKFEFSEIKSERVLTKWRLHGKKVLGFLGSFYRYEGLHLALEALPQILQKEPNAILFLVGGGPEEDALKRQVKERGLTENVLFIGRVPHDEIAEYYSVIDIFIYPRESIRLTEMVTPLKPLEAMAQGGLIAASNIGGHREMIFDGKNGFFFQPDDIDDMARVVSDLISHESTWHDLSRAARTYVETSRSWPNSVKQTISVYERLLKAALTNP